MVDWNDASGLQIEMLLDAVLGAFPNPEDFETFLLLRMQHSYAQLSGNKVNYRNGATQVLVQEKADGELNRLVAELQITKGNNSRVKALRNLGGLTSTPPLAGRTLEDIVRQDAGFQDVLKWIRSLERLTAQICRIEYPVNQGLGTGWLVADDLLLTNGHVAAPIVADPGKAADYLCRFDYATDTTGTNPGVTYKLADPAVVSSSPAAPSELGAGVGAEGPSMATLDYALLKLASKVGATAGPSGQARGHIVTRRGTAVPANGNIVVVLQHPSGDPLKLDLGYFLGPNANGTRVKHNANTIGGSSGSPCLDVKLQLVALHNSGDPLYDGGPGPAKENHAVPLELILTALDGNAPKFWV